MKHKAELLAELRAEESAELPPKKKRRLKDEPKEEPKEEAKEETTVETKEEPKEEPRRKEPKKGAQTGGAMHSGKCKTPARGSERADEDRRSWSCKFLDEASCPGKWDWASQMGPRWSVVSSDGPLRLRFE